MNKNICQFLLGRIRTVPGKTVRYKSANIPCNLLSNHSVHLCNGKSLQQHATGLHLDLPNLLKWNDTVGGRRHPSCEPSPSVRPSRRRQARTESKMRGGGPRNMPDTVACGATRCQPCLLAIATVTFGDRRTTTSVLFRSHWSFSLAGVQTSSINL